MRADVEAAIERAGLSARVTLLGLRRDVPEILGASDVLALSSIAEGLARVLPQAMAAGLPIVATNVDGAPDAITDGENGWLVPVGATDALGDRLIQLAGEPENARRMGQRGRDRVEEFSAVTMVRQLEALYTRVAREKGVFGREHSLPVASASAHTASEPAAPTVAPGER
jgi:glycosyltransferase involved in cell wall biosynthesis